jgi:glutathione synthase/RimK-type ligase-like ATP-grasp enzyme
VILAWGASDDPPTAAVLEQLRIRGADAAHVDRNGLASLRYDVTVDGTATGWIEVGDRRIDLGDIAAMYLRPEATRVSGATSASACLLAVAASIDATVVNRPAAGRSNLAKPFQLGLIEAAGFAVPPTLVTTDPSAARRFLDQHGRVVYKSVSGVRSIVATIDADGAGRLADVSTGPVQLQRWIEGIDVRVHVVGEQWFATAIQSDAADYRYGGQAGHETAIVATDVDDELGKRLVRLAAGMDLLVAGIDLRVTPDDEWYCFEVNPSPGFTFYEDVTGQPIAAAIADLLLRG